MTKYLLPVTFPSKFHKTIFTWHYGILLCLLFFISVRGFPQQEQLIQKEFFFKRTFLSIY
ncbi:hypothetical protein D0T08_01335 [Emticicia sp. C21]|nr:hypothetical protein D0T08_01335 [Emticicia sp. C21]